jgi:hypothetical protein
VAEAIQAAAVAKVTAGTSKRMTKTDRLTSGNSAWCTDIKIWFVMIKDRKERFQDNNQLG